VHVTPPTDQPPARLPDASCPPGPGPVPAGAPAHPIRAVVVVGAGLAGAQTVAALRAQGFDGHLTLLGAEPLAPYDRPPLSKHLLDRTDPAWLVDELGVDALTLADEVLLATAATGLFLDRFEVRLTTTRGELRADAVVIASGAQAVRPTGWDGAVVLHTAADAAALRARLRPGSRLVVVGAGWIGAEVAGVAAAAGADVTVVEAAPSPLAEALGVAVGAFTAPWYEAAGVRLLAGIPAAEVRADGVRLADGRRLAADVVLAAVGARPATSWLGGALTRDPDGALRVDAGYTVVGAPGHVRAVGDAARRWSPRHGWVPGGHWDGALRGPAIAVRALLAGPGEPAPDDPAPYVFSTQLGHELTLYGARHPTDELVLRGSPTRPGGWTALWFAAPPGSDRAHGGARARSDPGDASTLTAVLTVDRPRDAGAARRLFAGATLPRLDPTVAADQARALRDAVLP